MPLADRFASPRWAAAQALRAARGFFLPSCTRAFISVRPAQAWSPATSLFPARTPPPANHSNATNSTFQFPIEVTVSDSAPSYQNNVTVTFTAPGSGPSASFPNSGLAMTDISGRARLTPTANGVAGAYQITATAAVGANTFQTSFVAANVNTANAAGACLVTTANDDFSVGSLRYQVAACGKGGTITFAPGINPVNLSVAQDIPLTQDLTIDGGGGVTINANGQSRIFFIAGGTITLKNLTLENGFAAGGVGGVGTAGEGAGGGAAGMGGAIFVNAGSLAIANVTFTNNLAAGGSGGSVLSGFFSGGGGGTGAPGGSSASTIAGNGGGGGDFGSSGGEGTNGPSNGSGDGAGGGQIGSGAFGGGGAGGIAAGGFGGGGGGELSIAGASGTFGGGGGPNSPTGGGYGGAGLGGAIFMRNGTLSLTNTTFISNNAIGGTSQSGGSNGQGKGGALYVSSTASAVSTSALPIFSVNSATSAGTGTACNAVVGSNALDTNDICGILTGPATHFSVSATASETAGLPFGVTVTALDENSNVVTGYTGTVHLTSTDSGFANTTGDSTLTNGVRTFSVEMKQAGTQTITATDTVNGLITGTSNSILVNPGAAAQLVLSAPPTTDVGETFSFSVRAIDSLGNTATNYSGTVHFTSSDATAVLPANSGLTSGTGVFNATLKTTGTQTVTATDTVSNTLTGTSNGITVSIPGVVVTTTADSGSRNTSSRAGNSGNRWLCEHHVRPDRIRDTANDHSEQWHTDHPIEHNHYRPDIGQRCNAQESGDGERRRRVEQLLNVYREQRSDRHGNPQSGDRQRPRRLARRWDYQ